MDVALFSQFCVRSTTPCLLKPENYFQQWILNLDFPICHSQFGQARFVEFNCHCWHELRQVGFCFGSKGMLSH